MQLSLAPRQSAPDIQVLKILGMVLAVHLALAWLLLVAPEVRLPQTLPPITIDIGAALPEQQRGLEEAVEAQAGQNAAASRPPAPRPTAKAPPAAKQTKPDKPLQPSPPKSESAPAKTLENVAPVAPPPEPVAAAVSGATVPKGQAQVTQETVRTAEPDLQAAYKDNPKPPYPKAAFRAGAEGTVEIAVEVNPDGSVASAVVASSSGHDLLDKSALDTVRAWRFKSARKDGVLSKSVVRVPITFRLRAAR